MEDDSGKFKKLFFAALVAVFMVVPLAVASPSTTNKTVKLTSINQSEPTYLVPENKIITNPKTIKVYITAYSSRPEETDDTPFITASGKKVRSGIVASNFLPLGTVIKIPELFGDRTFVVEDRMNPRFKDRIDIWFPSHWEAKKFGVKKAEILVF